MLWTALNRKIISFCSLIPSLTNSNYLKLLSEEEIFSTIYHTFPPGLCGMVRQIVFRSPMLRFHSVTGRIIASPRIIEKIALQTSRWGVGVVGFFPLSFSNSIEGKFCHRWKLYVLNGILDSWGSRHILKEENRKATISENQLCQRSCICLQNCNPRQRDLYKLHLIN